MHLKQITKDSLLDYLVRQLEHFFPDDDTTTKVVLAQVFDEALERLRICINAVRMWKPEEFDYLHSSQYAHFLYFLSNTLWKNQKNERVCTKLFLLNKALNALDCFYEVEMPDIFFIGHSVGIVVAKAHYSNYLVLYQNSTVGKNHGVAPFLEEGVILYPNTAIIGRCKVRAHTALAQGVSVINQDTPGKTIVFQGELGNLIHKPFNKAILENIFRM